MEYGAKAKRDFKFAPGSQVTNCNFIVFLVVQAHARVMRFISFFLLLLFLSACRPKAQPLTVPDLPEPPQQRAAWFSSTNSILAEAVSATKSLFDEGLADPRGCEYRQVEIHVGEVWRGDGGMMKTHAWVLPGSSGSNLNFVVCWNGLVYPAVSVGEKADLKSDMEALANVSSTNISRMRMALYGRAIPERMSVAQDSILPIKACLLLRLGEDDLASNVWNVCNVSLESARGQGQSKDPYLMLAGDWAWTLYDRTVCAHMRGDVPLALVSARKLAQIQPKIEAEASKRGFPHQQGGDYPMQKRIELPYLTFLDQLPQLLAVLERRVRAPKQKSVIQSGLTNYPNQSQRIAALIEDLDLVNARQFGQPGGVILFSDPLVAALIQEGDASVEPLLDCMEHDKRLTCSVSFGRDFFRSRNLIPVSSAAKSALQQILHAEFPGVAEIRAYWENNKGVKLEDRWYETLKKDDAGTQQWLQAARDIMQPENVSGVPGAGFYTSAPLKAGEKPKLRGEVLRSKERPSITDLLLKRAIEVAGDANQKNQGVDAIDNGLELVTILSQWDKAATAVIPAQSLMRHAIALWANSGTFIMSSGHELARYIPRLTQIRVEGGDTNALSEYAAWVKSADEEKIDLYPVEAFEPLWTNPKDQTVSTVSEWLFNAPSSPWSKLPWKRSSFHDPLESELVKSPAFRRLLARELENQTTVGTMQWHTGNGINIDYTVVNSKGSFQFPWPEVNSPADGTKVEIRRCDWVAWSLSRSKQIPFFNPFASVEKRNEAIKNAKAELIK